MILYLIKSGICLALLLTVYHLFLEREKMHGFKRFFLLSGMLFSFIVPLTTFSFGTEIVGQYTFLQTISSPASGFEFPQKSTATTGMDYWKILWTFYVIIAGVQLMRFLSGLIAMFQKVGSNQSISFRGINLILTNEQILPYTFLNYVFVNEDNFRNGQIEEELFTHELAHARQHHSIDILLMELVQVLFWFNPLMVYYKKAIQLNHEYLADEAVLQSHKNIHEYQHLLLDKVAMCTKIKLASNFNYLVTKKRLTMMTKTISKTRNNLIAFSMLPLFALMFLFFGNNSLHAQQSTDSEIKDELFKNATIIFENDNGQDIKKAYKDLTEAEKASIPPPPPMPPSADKKMHKSLPEGTIVYFRKNGEVQANIPPPPPPMAPDKHVKKLVKKGATFFKDGVKISGEEAIRLASDRKSGYSIQTNTTNGKTVVHFKRER